VTTGRLSRIDKSTAIERMFSSLKTEGENGNGNQLEGNGCIVLRHS
jgi:hypothetical protein